MIGEKYKGHVAMVICNLIFGLNIPICKSVLASGWITPFNLTLMRMCGGAALFWALSMIQPREKVARKDLLMLFFASLLGVQLNQIAFITGISMTSPINASIISTITPILTMLLAALFLREPITWKKGIGVAIGASGALMLVLRSTGSAGEGHVTGDLLCIASTLCFSCYLTLFKPLIARYSPVTLMKWMFLYAAVCCTPFGWSELVAIDPAQIPWMTITEVIYIVFMASFMSYLLLAVGQKLLRPTLVSMYNYMQPLVASLAAVAVGIDTFGWGKGLAGGLVFLGVWVVNKSKSREQLDAEKASKPAA